MRRRVSRWTAFLGTVLVVAALVAARFPSGSPKLPSGGTYGMRVAPVELQSAGVMYFGSDGTLFVADSRAGAIYAIDVAEPLRDSSDTGVRIDNVDQKIATALGTTRDEIRIRDMVAHPRSQSLYFSLSKGKGADAKPYLVRVTKVSEDVTVLPLDNIRHARAQLTDAPAADAKTQWGESKRTLSITDLALSDGVLYVAGLSNEEFASALRRVPYPFGGSVATTTVEIYHTSHDRFETASPIETMLPITLDGRASVLASYGCSPVAVFDRAQLASAKHLRGKTVAELGGGNRPLDMVRYVSPTSGKEFVMIANSDRTLMRLDPAEIASAPGLSTPVKQAYQPAGVGYLPVASFGVLQLDNYNRKNLVVLVRNAETGALDVRSQGLGWL